MEEISLRDLFFILRKWMPLIIALTVIAVVIAGVLSFYVLEPEYQTFTTLMVGKPKDYQSDARLEYNEILLNQKLVSTYGELVKSRTVVDKVIGNLNLDMNYNTFTNKVSVNLVKDTEIIKIQVTDHDPYLAADIANETAKVFMDTVKEIMKVENVQVIDDAQPSLIPVKPKPKLNMAIAGVLGLMIGVFFSFLVEYLDNTIKSEEDVERHLGLAVLGGIPEVRGKDVGLISMTDPKSPFTEAFRTLRTNIQFSSIDKEIKALIVTSATPTEGKSTTSLNLASIIAQNNKKVLLIDCDLRKPKLHEKVGITNFEGLTNVLMGERTLEDVVHQYVGENSFYILPSGPIPPNPAELLGSNRMKSFLDSVREEFDMIILDSSPIGLVTDSAVLSNIADGILYVTAVGQTDIEIIKEGKELLDKVKANIIGVVLNRIPTRGRAYYRYHYYQYYSYYGNEPRKKKKKKKRRAKA